MRYHRHVLIAGEQVPINSEDALDELGTLVAERYKRDYIRLTTTEVGRQKLHSAHYSFVAASRELNQIVERGFRVSKRVHEELGKITFLARIKRLEDTSA